MCESFFNFASLNESGAIRIFIFEIFSHVFGGIFLRVGYITQMFNIVNQYYRGHTHRKQESKDG